MPLFENGSHFASRPAPATVQTFELVDETAHKVVEEARRCGVSIVRQSAVRDGAHTFRHVTVSGQWGAVRSFQKTFAADRIS